MNFISEYFLYRAIKRVTVETMIYGSSHYQFSFRHKWSPLRLIFGPFKYKFFHPKDVICTCGWAKTTAKDHLGYPQ